MAKVAFQYLQGHMPNQELNILDIGCGYGRDALYLSKNPDWRILGIDVS
ncbi:class I SAM-dependent methyltransferase [Candidatus Bathyarchaeota archaeon]|nr:class I SAM-dependent methyltransferase [Candidatus Bathyarchaeota archaeon]